jgi:hypothetical protein
MQRKLRQLVDVQQKILVVQEHQNEIDSLKRNLKCLDTQVAIITSGDFKVAK